MSVAYTHTRADFDRHRCHAYCSKMFQNPFHYIWTMWILWSAYVANIQIENEIKFRILKWIFKSVIRQMMAKQGDGKVERERKSEIEREIENSNHFNLYSNFNETSPLLFTISKLFTNSNWIALKSNTHTHTHARAIMLIPANRNAILYDPLNNASATFSVFNIRILYHYRVTFVFGSHRAIYLSFIWITVTHRNRNRTFNISIDFVL